MKKFVPMLIAVSILLSCVPSAAAAENAIEPRWAVIDSLTADLNINWLGVATFYGKITADESPSVKIVVELQQFGTAGWATIASWTATNAKTASISKTYTVLSGYTYRVFVTGYVYDSNGNLIETGTAFETAVY